MYRNFFSQDKELELFSSDEIESRLGKSCVDCTTSVLPIPLWKSPPHLPPFSVYV